MRSTVVLFAMKAMPGLRLGRASSSVGSFGAVMSGAPGLRLLAKSSSSAAVMFGASALHLRRTHLVKQESAISELALGPALLELGHDFVKERAGARDEGVRLRLVEA